MTPQRRQPKGTPGGGQFAGGAHGAAPITLTTRPGLGGVDREEAALLPRWAAARDRRLDDHAVADLMDHRQPACVRHDTVNRGDALVLTLAAADPEPAIRAAAVGSPLIPSHARYALRRDVAALQLSRLARAC